MSNPTVNTDCQITNNSGQSIVVLDAYTSATNVANNSPAKGYQQNLKALPFAGGGATLADGATGTVTLNDTRVSNGQTQPNYLYQLLISQPSGLFPVMDVGEALDFKKLAYPPITVTSAAAKNMTTAFTFMQNLLAYPGSNLAKGFVTALANAQTQKTTDAMMKAVSDYFNTTKSFQGLDFPSYLAVSTHMNAFAWTWGLSGGQPGRTYYLYAESDATGGGSGNKTPSSQGSLTCNLVGGGTTVSDPTDPNSGYSVVLTPTSGSSVQLTFNQGQFVNDPNADVPSICLQGSYALKSTFTQQASDNVLWPILVGNLNGKKVIGVSQKPEDAFVAWLKSLLPTSFNDLINSFLKIMGIVMAIDFLKNKLAGKNDKLADDETNENDGDAPSDEQISESDSDADDIEEESLVDNRGRAARLDSDVEVPDEDSIDSSLDDANSSLSSSLDEVQADQLSAALDEYRSQCEDLAEIEVNPSLEDAFGKVVDAGEKLPDARESGEFSDVKTDLADAKVSINDSIQEMGDSVSQELQDQINESQAEAAEYESAADNIDDQSESVDEGSEDFEGELVE